MKWSISCQGEVDKRSATDKNFSNLYGRMVVLQAKLIYTATYSMMAN